jgi:uncharacterized protein (TIGR02996 family)
VSDDAAFLAAIVAAPGDDLPRLVYADWLDEYGGRPVTAGFIRVQVALAELRGRRDRLGRRTTHRNAEKIRPLADRERELFRCLTGWLPTGWADSVVTLDAARLDWAPAAYEYRTVGLLHRGFVVRMACPAEQWVRFGDAVLLEHPIERVRLTTEPEWDAGTAAFWLIDDPKQAAGMVTFERALAEQRPEDGDDLLPAVLRCRWPGVEFEGPTHGPLPLRAAVSAAVATIEAARSVQRRLGL